MINLRKALGEKSAGSIPVMVFKDKEGRLVSIASPVNLEISEVETAPIISLSNGMVETMFPRPLWSMVRQFIHQPFTSYLAK